MASNNTSSDTPSLYLIQVHEEIPVSINRCTTCKPKNNTTTHLLETPGAKVPNPNMSGQTPERSLDQPSDEAIAKLGMMARPPGEDEINKLNLPATNTDEENGSGEDFDFSDSELPSRADIKPRKKKKKSKTSQHTTEEKK